MVATQKEIDQLSSINFVCAFDYAEALSFFGETEHYLFYSLTDHPEIKVQRFNETLRKCKFDVPLIVPCIEGTLINYIGGLIEDGKIPSKAVKLFLIDQNDKVSCHTFDEKGILDDTFQFGFFYADVTHHWNKFKKLKKLFDR